MSSRGCPSFVGVGLDRFPHCRVVLLIGRSASVSRSVPGRREGCNEGGLCRLVSTSGIGCFGDHPLVPGDLLTGGQRNVVVNSTYRENRLCRSVLRKVRNRRLRGVTSFCSCLRVRPGKGGTFVLHADSGRCIMGGHKRRGGGIC